MKKASHNIVNLQGVSRFALVFGILMLSGFALILPGCTGNTGPQGPQGPPGGGNVANVYVTLFSVPANSGWTGVGSPTSYFYATYPIDSISSPSNDVVEVYYNDSTQNGPIWTALPLTGMELFHHHRDSVLKQDTTDALSYSWKASISGSPGTVTVKYYFLNGLSCITPMKDLFFYVTVIPQSVMKQHPGTNWKNPNAVLGLPEVQAALKHATH